MCTCRHPFFFFKCIFLLMLIMKYTAVGQKYICFSELSVQQLISGVVILSETCLVHFEEWQMSSIRSTV